MTIARTFSDLDKLLAPFEARPTKSPEAVAVERRRQSFGANLARIQGANYNEARARLVELIVLGKATRQEVISLGAEIARQGLFNTPNPVEHDR